MMHARALLNAFAYGLALSAPIGPVAMLCVRRSLAGRPWLGLATGLGCASCDFGTYWIVASGINAAPIISNFSLHAFEGASGVLLIGLSLVGMFTKLKPSLGDIQKVASATSTVAFLLAWTEGLVITLANPLNMAGVAVIVASLIKLNDGGRLTSISIGITSGVSCWWMVLTWSTWKLRKWVSGQSLYIVDRAISVGLGIAGLIILVRTFL